jgi:DNA-binding NtrC family response regulator
MNELVLVSTHRLPLAGALREAFRKEGFQVDLVPGPDHLPDPPPLRSPRQAVSEEEPPGSGEAPPGSHRPAVRTPGNAGSEPVLLVLTGEEGGDGELWRDRVGPGGEVPLFAILPGDGGRARGRALGAVEIFGPDPSPDEVALVGRRTVERRKLQRLTGIVGESEAIRELLERVVQMAPVDSTVLLTGESGTGKELVARGLHALSPRRHRAFLAVNVAALSDSLLESELFGHEKGSFTGAIDTRKGFFELAHKGTLFLDEIGEMPLSTQTKLLRVLEQREFLRVGGEKAIHVDVRIVAATNQELRSLVASGEFRRDLYYRLNILDLRLPPLRERKEDIPLLVRHFIREVTQRIDRPFPGILPETMEVLVRHDWPGNVRELRNLVESMVVLAPGRKIGPEDIPRELRSGEGRSLLPVPWAGARGRVVRREEEDGEGGGRSRGDLRPELEFVFRTLVELRVDMEELRREFEAYRQELDHRIEDATPVSEVGTRAGIPRTPLGPGTGEIRAEGDREPEGDRLSDGVPGWEGSPGRDRGSEKEEDARASSQADEGIRFPPGMTMEELEEEAIRAVLQEVDGNRRQAAERLGIGERTLYRKIRKFGIEG